MLSILLEIKTGCTHCGNPLPVNAFAENIFCDKCNKENTFDAKLWSSLFEDIFKDVIGFEEGEGRNSRVMTGQYNIDMLYGKKNARCDSCKTDIPDDELNKFTDKGKYKCAKCSKEIFVRPANELLKSIISSARYIVGEDENMLYPSSDKPVNKGTDKPVMFTCPSCAGNLEIDGKERLIVCKYCQSKVYLPDDLWFSLHPVASKERWYITLDNRVLSELLPDWSSLYDTAIDKDGNLYFVSTLDSFDEHLTIWSCSPEIKKRWSVEYPGTDKYHTHITASKDGNLYVWDSTKHSMTVLSCKDGSKLRTVKGGTPSKDNPYPFSLHNCETMISDSDNTLLALINSTFVRFNPDGTRTSLWGSPSENEERGFFSKLFSRSDDRIDIPEDNNSDSPALEKAGSKPRNVDSSDTKMFLGWDDYIYIYNLRGGKVTIAKYDRSGEKYWDTAYEFKEIGSKIYADAVGNIYVVGKDDNDKAKLIRISADGRNFEVVLKDFTKGGTLRFGDYGDSVLVSKEGVIYIVNSSEEMRVFNPDFSVKYVSKSLQEDDEDEKEENNSD